MSDTPISDSTPHNVADLGMLCRRLERQLNAANKRINQLEENLMDMKNKHAALVADVALYEDRGERIKRLEEAGDAMVSHAKALGMDGTGLVKRWLKAKEAKL